MSPRSIPAITLTQRKRKLGPVLAMFGIEQYLTPLARRANVDKIIARLKTLRDLGVPLKGLLYKMSLSEAEFNKIVKRYQGKYHFTPGQEKMFGFLRSKGISEENAARLASNKMYHSMRLSEKIAFFESIRLDPKRYGVERIPAQYYENQLSIQLNLIKKGIKKRVLWPLEDSFASKKLDAVLPNWRKIGLFSPKKNGRKLIRPAKILAMVLQLQKRGLPLRADYIVSTLEHVQKKASGHKATPYKKLLVGSLFDPKRRKLKATRIRDLETEIGGLTNQLNSLVTRQTRGSFDRTFLEKQKNALEDRRTALVKERNSLLAK